jgi:hypothetical protein
MVSDERKQQLIEQGWSVKHLPNNHPAKAWEGYDPLGKDIVTVSSEHAAWVYVDMMARMYNPPVRPTS